MQGSTTRTSTFISLNRSAVSYPADIAPPVRCQQLFVKAVFHHRDVPCGIWLKTTYMHSRAPRKIAARRTAHRTRDRSDRRVAEHAAIGWRSSFRGALDRGDLNHQGSSDQDLRRLHYGSNRDGRKPSDAGRTGTAKPRNPPIRQAGVATA